MALIEERKYIRITYLERGLTSRVGRPIEAPIHLRWDEYSRTADDMFSQTYTCKVRMREDNQPRLLSAAHVCSMASFFSRRSPVLCRHGCVACNQPLAGEAGLSVLKRGGNAADAAVAAAAALAVTQPCSTGLGGDCFCLFYDAATGSVRGINGRYLFLTRRKRAQGRRVSCIPH